ncbi:thioredoxin family protein [Niabella drilacis]|uniref:Thioredoxin n=1 Tax=Niabella drilacis (strain DSM 25811 / CCM 8410 / CCUG 62505 / LMG 26954 / E90) TaxID=1285928 RepID=A0A1G6PSG3_NIADE|nr:thioredoxin family protein [Niabella drilacis]SDC82337.1 Thioredoxin [Niabella drilacis]
MKKIILAVGFCCFLVAGHAQQYEVTVDDHNGKQEKMYRGHITDSLLKADTAFKWFEEGEKIYEPRPEVVKTVKKNRTQIWFKVFMGTWCPDSHYVIPRFYKILEEAGFDKGRVSLLAVDRSKKDKTKLAENLNVTRVPTIIVYHYDTELGRVVEYGETGRFDTELADIIKKAK